MAQKFAEKTKKGELVSIYEIAYAYNKFILRKAENQNYTDENTDTKALVLEDVEIQYLNGNTIRTNSFVLFTDQITGIVPGKAKFEN